MTYRKGFNGYIPFRTGCSKVSQSLHNVCFYICFHLLQEEVSLTKAKQNTELCVYPKVNKSHFIALFVYLLNSSIFFFTLDPCVT